MSWLLQISRVILIETNDLTNVLDVLCHAAGMRLRKDMYAFKAKDLCTLIWACATVNHKHPFFFHQAFTSFYSEDFLPHVSLRDMVQMTWSSASLGLIQPSQLQQLSKFCMVASHRHEPTEYL